MNPGRSSIYRFTETCKVGYYRFQFQLRKVQLRYINRLFLGHKLRHYKPKIEMYLRAQLPYSFFFLLIHIGEYFSQGSRRQNSSWIKGRQGQEEGMDRMCRQVQEIQQEC